MVHFMNYNVIATNMKVGKYVIFPSLYNPSLQLTGYVVCTLEHTRIVDISEMASFSINGCQVVQHEQY